MVTNLLYCWEGGTTRIGDPSGKDKTRTILSEKEIEKNIKNIEKILKNF